MNTIYDIYVTEHLIETAIRGDAKQCMIARAMQASGLIGVEVIANSIYFMHDGKQREAHITASLASVYDAWDEGFSVPEMRFQIGWKAGWRISQSPSMWNLRLGGKKYFGAATKRAFGTMPHLVKEVALTLPVPTLPVAEPVALNWFTVGQLTNSEVAQISKIEAK